MQRTNRLCEIQDKATGKTSWWEKIGWWSEEEEEEEEAEEEEEEEEEEEAARERRRYSPVHAPVLQAVYRSMLVFNAVALSVRHFQFWRLSAI